MTSIKKVVDVELTIQVEDGAIVENGLPYVMNAWHENGVEAAVQLNESNGAQTTLVNISANKGSVDDETKIIRKAFAMGIDNAIQVTDPAIISRDAFVHTRILQNLNPPPVFNRDSQTRFIINASCIIRH